MLSRFRISFGALSAALAWCARAAPVVADDDGLRGVVFSDGFEQGNLNGWTFPWEPAENPDGMWAIGDPVGTMSGGQQAQPEFAFAGTGCAFTGQNPTGTAGAGDVDNAVVHLMSPTLALAGQVAAQLSYVRWFFSNESGASPRCYFAVQARSSPASAWVDIERITASANTWTLRSVQLEQFISLTDTVQIRFSANDPVQNFSIIEAAVDDVQITTGSGCTSDAQCAPAGYCAPGGSCTPYGDGDFDADDDVDLADFAAFQGCYGQVAGGLCLPANLAGSATIDALDYAEFSALLSPPG